MGIKKVRFYHYLFTLIIPPLTYFLVGRPLSGLVNALVWSPIVYGLCFVYGIYRIHPLGHLCLCAREHRQYWGMGPLTQLGTRLRVGLVWRRVPKTDVL